MPVRPARPANGGVAESVVERPGKYTWPSGQFLYGWSRAILESLSEDILNHANWRRRAQHQR